MSMNSLNVEQARKVVVPIFISLGGLCTTYIGYIFFPIFFGYMRFHKSLPTKEMLDKAWEGFEYDPESNSIQQLAQVLLRSSAMFKETMSNYTQLIKKQRLSNIEDLKEYVKLVKEEIQLKIMKSRTYEFVFLTHKHHQYEQFYQKYFQDSNDEQVHRLIGEYEMKFLICHDEYKQKLPTINQCIEQLNKILPMMMEKKPQIDRISDMIQADGEEKFQLVYCLKYLEDVSESKFKIQFRNLIVTLSSIKLENITKTNVRNEIKRLLAEYQKVWKILMNN